MAEEEWIFNNGVTGRDFNSMLTVENWSNVFSIMVLRDYTTLRKIRLTFCLFIRLLILNNLN
jgi:hypothetical protein